MTATLPDISVASGTIYFGRAVCGESQAGFLETWGLLSSADHDATGLNNNKFGPYETKKWTFSANSWAAINVVSGTYSKVFITWNCPDTTWSNSIALAGDSCQHTFSVPVDYTILTSANSTTGDDGDWTAVDSVKGNNVGARGHLVDFTGAKWIKMAIAKGSGSIDEIEVFDASNGGYRLPCRFFVCGGVREADDTNYLGFRDATTRCLTTSLLLNLTI